MSDDPFGDVGYSRPFYIKMSPTPNPYRQDSRQEAGRKLARDVSHGCSATLEASEAQGLDFTCRARAVVRRRLPSLITT